VYVRKERGEGRTGKKLQENSGKGRKVQMQVSVGECRKVEESTGKSLLAHGSEAKWKVQELQKNAG
jgi:hypothetical protein